MAFGIKMDNSDHSQDLTPNMGLLNVDNRI